MINKRKSEEIESIVFDALSKSNSLGVFPTPVDKVLKYADLRVNSGVDLAKVPINLIPKLSHVVKRGIAKIRGVLDRREKVIYLDFTQHTSKLRFVQLHEVGHELCSWQGNLLSFLDDDETLDVDIKEKFEAEANYFASASLFQLGIFSDKMAELPLDIATPIQLSKIFGSSIHASLRRYVEKSRKRCALLVLDKENKGKFDIPRLNVRNYFQSKSFTAEWGEIEWETTLDFGVPFVQDFLSRRRFLKSELSIDLVHESIDCTYHYFDNGYNIFILMYPKGETIKTKTTFVINN